MSNINGVNRGGLPIPTGPVGGKPVAGAIPTTLSGAEAARNSEKAFDAVFNTNVTSGAIVGGEAAINQLTGAAATEMLGELRALSTMFMREAPGDAPIAAGFAPDVSVAGEVSFAHTGGEFSDITGQGAPPPSEDPALDQVHDSFWNQVAQGVPSNDTLATNPAMRYLVGVQGQQTKEQISQALDRVVANMASEGAQKAEAQSDAAEEKVITLNLQKMGTASGIDWATADISMLVQIVLFQCGRDNDLDLKDAIAEIKKRNEQKQLMREQMQAMKKDRLAMEDSLRSEWQANLASGALKSGTTFEDYCAFRKITPGGVDEKTGKWVNGSLAQPQPFAGPFPPNMAPPTPPPPPPPDKDAANAAYDAALADVDAANQEVADANAALAAANSEKDCAVGMRDAELNQRYAEIDASGATQSEKDAQKCQAQMEINDKWAPSIAAADNKIADANAALTAGQDHLDTANAALDVAAGVKEEADNYVPPPPYADPQTVGEGAQAQSFSSYQAMEDDLKNKMDSVSELAEQDQLRLQLLMDRKAKCSSMLSNIMKKISDTAQSIIGNMK